MGCDIHGWVEVNKYPMIGSEYWYSLVNVDHWERNYLVFARMFNVRNDFEDYKITSIAGDRGLPKTSDYAEEEPTPRDLDAKYWEGDGHSYSWISLEEIRDSLSRITEKRGGYSDFSVWLKLFQIMEVLASMYGVKNVRLVVWFDN
jgi:hypothetical protein